jgi:hypothetical protein
MNFVDRRVGAVLLVAWMRFAGLTRGASDLVLPDRQQSRPRRPLFGARAGRKGSDGVCGAAAFGSSRGVAPGSGARTGAWPWHSTAALER